MLLVLCNLLGSAQLKSLRVIIPTYLQLLAFGILWCVPPPQKKNDLVNPSPELS